MDEQDREPQRESGAEWFEAGWEETTAAPEPDTEGADAQAAAGTEHTVILHAPAEVAAVAATGPEATERRGFRIPVKNLVFLGAAIVGLYLVWPQLVELFDAVPGLRTIEWWWFALMVGLEAASFACYWGLMRVTVHERRWFVIATTQLAGNAFSRIVPGGAASGGSVSYQMLVAAGLPRGRAVTGLTSTTLLSTAVLFTLPALSLPAILGGAPIDPSLLRALEFGVGVAVLIIGVGALLLFTDRTLVWAGRVVQRVLNRVRRTDPPRSGLPALLLDERDLIKRALGGRWWVALPCSAGNWLLDFAALLAALAAVGATPRPSLVLLAYVVAALLATIPLTPGGLGFVEVGLAAALGIAGVGAAEATTAVLAYRLVAFWLPIPAGLVAGVLFRNRFGGPVADQAGGATEGARATDD